MGRKAIVLISDGVDYGSRVDREEAVEAAHKSDVVVYGVRYYDRGFYHGRMGFARRRRRGAQKNGAGNRRQCVRGDAQADAAADLR